jgi:hypothetical protein
MTVEPTWIDVGGLTVRAPVTAGTNLLLSVQCAYYARRLAGGGSERDVWWGRFLAAMSAATAAGVLKHGFPHELSPDAFAAVLWTSSLAGGAAVYMAQRATIASRAAAPERPRLERTAGAGVAAFLAAGVPMGPSMWLLIAYTAAGLTPVIVVEAGAARRGDPAGARVAGGLVVALLTGIVYGLQISLGRWFNHIDLAHALMGVSYFLIFTGTPTLARLAPK